VRNRPFPIYHDITSKMRAFVLIVMCRFRSVREKKRHSIIQGAGVGTLRLITKKGNAQGHLPFKQFKGTARHSLVILRRTQVSFSQLYDDQSRRVMYRTKLLGADSEHTTNRYDLFLVAHCYCVSLPTSSPMPRLSIADMAQRQAQHVRVPMPLR